MNTIISIIDAIGVNQTVFLQLGIFLIVYVYLLEILFKPYFKAHEQRVDNTQGAEDLAERVTQEVQELNQTYQKKARLLNNEQKTIYEALRSEALHEQNELVLSARTKAKVLLDDARKELDVEVERVRSELNRDIPDVSEVVVSTLVGKGLG